MPIHRITLGGPWSIEVPGRCGSAATVPFQDLPSVLKDADGGVRLVRRFNWPSNPDPAVRIHLSVSEVAGKGRVILNGADLGPVASNSRIELTTPLKLSNILALELVGSPPGLNGPVALEIDDG